MVSRRGCDSCSSSTTPPGLQPSKEAAFSSDFFGVGVSPASGFACGEILQPVRRRRPAATGAVLRQASRASTNGSRCSGLVPVSLIACTRSDEMQQKLRTGGTGVDPIDSRDSHPSPRRWKPRAPECRAVTGVGSEHGSPMRLSPATAPFQPKSANYCGSMVGLSQRFSCCAADIGPNAAGTRTMTS